MDDPEREWSARAGARDVAAGAALAILGLVAGGSSLSSGHDRLDVVFDGLAVLWMLFGLGRIVSARRRRTERVDVPSAVALTALAFLGLVACLRLLG